MHYKSEFPNSKTILKKLQVDHFAAEKFKNKTQVDHFAAEKFKEENEVEIAAKKALESLLKKSKETEAEVAVIRADVQQSLDRWKDELFQVSASIKKTIKKASKKAEREALELALMQATSLRGGEGGEGGEGGGKEGGGGTLISNC
jgi:hypothetical protein